MSPELIPPGIFQPHKDGIVLNIFVQPKASKNQIAGCHGDAVKVKLTAPPVEGEANRQCLKFLAKALKRPKSALEIVSGHTSRHKRILIHADSDHDPEAIKKSVSALLFPSGLS